MWSDFVHPDSLEQPKDMGELYRNIARLTPIGMTSSSHRNMSVTGDQYWRLEVTATHQEDKESLGAAAVRAMLAMNEGDL